MLVSPEDPLQSLPKLKNCNSRAPGILRGGYRMADSKVRSTPWLVCFAQVFPFPSNLIVVCESFSFELLDQTFLRSYKLNNVVAKLKLNEKKQKTPSKKSQAKKLNKPKIA